MAFNNFPYTNMQDLNIDWLLRKMIQTDANSAAAVAAATSAKEIAETLTNFVNNYFDNLDIQEEVNTKINQMLADGYFDPIVEGYVPDAVSDWLIEHITPTTPIVDSSLTIDGAAADSGRVGEIFGGISETTENICTAQTGRWQALTANGTIIDSSEFYVGMKNYVPCQPGTSYGFSAFNLQTSTTSRMFVTWYDSTGTFISNQYINRAGQNIGYVWQSPDNAAFVHMSVYNGYGISEFANLEIVEGTTAATTYTPPYTANDRVARAKANEIDEVREELADFEATVSAQLTDTNSVRWRSSAADIVLLGDSIVQGVGSSDYSATGENIATIGGTTFKRNVGTKSWGARFKAYVESYYYGLTVINNGLSGQGINVITENLAALVPEGTKYAVVCVGVNNRSYSATTILNNYRALLTALINRNVEVLAVSAIDVNGATFQTSMGLMNTALEKACQELGVKYFNLYGRFNQIISTENKADFYSDTLHPNDKGYAAIFGAIRDLLNF